MKVLLAAPSLQSTVGGPAYSVSSICRYLQHAGIDAATVTRPLQGGMSYSPVMREGVLRDAQVVHNFGTWTGFNHGIAVAARQAKVPQVFCPMGMLEPWALSQKQLKKRLGWLLYQCHDIDRSHAVHATARSEAESLRRLGIKVPIALIPHGIDLPSVDSATLTSQRDSGTKTLLFLSRIHPKKGLLELVQACSRLKHRNWKVVVAGPDVDGYQTVVERAVTAAKLQDKFSFVGPVYGEEKTVLFAQADLFVLPTHSENFGLVIPEALAHGIPVITTTGAPWAELHEVACGWWIPPNAAALESTLSEATLMTSAALAEMGARGRVMVKERYAWPVIIQKNIALYEWIIGGGSPPDFIFD